jgi:hypothetical protein
MHFLTIDFDRMTPLKRDASKASRMPSIGIGINHIDFRSTGIAASFAFAAAFHTDTHARHLMPILRRRTMPTDRSRISTDIDFEQEDFQTGTCKSAAA